MKKLERDLFYKNMEGILPIMTPEDRQKIEFIRSFMEERFEVDDFENSFVKIETIGTRSLMYLLFVMLLEYDDSRI